MMKNNLFEECLDCEDKCCKWKDIIFHIYLTPKEEKRIHEINKSFPCVYFTNQELCGIQKEKPLDCQLFPFDIKKTNGKFYWMSWGGNCKISSKENKEDYLKYFEKTIIPSLKPYLREYSSFYHDELIKKYKCQILREVNTD